MELVCLLYIQETLISPVYLPHKYSYVITLPNTFRQMFHFCIMSSCCIKLQKPKTLFFCFFTHLFIFSDLNYVEIRG